MKGRYVRNAGHLRFAVRQSTIWRKIYQHIERDIFFRKHMFVFIYIYIHTWKIQACTYLYIYITILSISIYIYILYIHIMFIALLIFVPIKGLLYIPKERMWHCAINIQRIVGHVHLCEPLCQIGLSLGSHPNYGWLVVWLPSILFSHDYWE